MIGQYVKICGVNDLAEGEVRTFKVNDHDILLAKYQGEIFALENICSHDGGELGEGRLVRGQLECPRHGARFDLKTGDAKAMPAAVGIGTYDLKIEDGEVMVELKD